MGLGQTMLTTAFLVLLTIAAMNANRMIVDRDSNYYEQEAYRQSAKLANALLAEIVTKKFDEQVDTSASGYLAASSFTTPGNLGPDPIYSTFWFFTYISGYEQNNVPLPDVVSNPNVLNYRSMNPGQNYYDDVDDYNGYTRIAQSGSLTGFNLSVQVYYVNKSNLNVNAGTRTYFKKIVVSVTNPTYFPKKDLDGDGQEDDDVTLTFSTVKAY